MKPKVSVIIPFYNDGYIIEKTVRRALFGLDPDDFEIIIVDDGSFFSPPTSLREYKNVHIIGCSTNKGVGHAFDTGVKQALGATLLLMGSDIYLKGRSWLTDALRIAKANPNGITCATCIGMSEQEGSLVEGRKRYGADILFKVDINDLPPNSPLRRNPDYRDILQAKWLPGKMGDEPYEIPAVLGASYVTTKEWYLRIGGFGWIKNNEGLTREEAKYQGFRRWGGLEPMISLKTWFSGGRCLISPEWETHHIFGREEHVRKSRGTQMDKYFFNKLLIAHSLFEPEETKILDNHLLKGRNENIARHWIKKNYKAILKEKEWNDRIKVNDYSLFIEKFGYDKNLFNK